jgi:hypothetical protein
MNHIVMLMAPPHGARPYRYTAATSVGRAVGRRGLLARLPHPEALGGRGGGAQPDSRA